MVSLLFPGAHEQADEVTVQYQIQLHSNGIFKKKRKFLESSVLVEKGNNHETQF